MRRHKASAPRRIVLMWVVWVVGCGSGHSTSGGAGMSGKPFAGGGAGGNGGAGVTNTGGSTGGVGLGTAGSSADAGTPSADASIPLTPEAEKVVMGLSQLPSGQPVDLFGNGSAILTLTMQPDGGFVYQGTQNGGTAPEFLVTNDGQGHETTTITPRGASPPIKTIQLTETTSTWQEVDSVDENFDGAFDHRYTWLFQTATPDAISYTEEDDPSETGNWSTTVTTTLSTDMQACAAKPTCPDGTGNGGSTTGGGDGGTCKGKDGFPVSAAFTRFLGPYDIEIAQSIVNNGISSAATGGLCDPITTLNIEDALGCAIGQLQCLWSSNKSQFKRVSGVLARSRRGGQPLLIGCGNACTDKVATTDGFPCLIPGVCNLSVFGARLNINPKQFNALDSNGQCNAMLHEFMHWGGALPTPCHDALGVDDVYSCGRWCGHCSDDLNGAPHNSSIDCARCGESLEAKVACGIQEETFPVDCAPLTAAGFECFDTGGNMAPGASCAENEECYCDETPSSPRAPFDYIETCPPGLMAPSPPATITSLCTNAFVQKICP